MQASSISALCMIAFFAAQTQTSQPITFNKHLAPILVEKCGACHHAGGAGPFSLLEYKEIRDRAAQIVKVTQSRYMPPWLPDEEGVKLAEEQRLTPEQLELIRR
jgi:hypothetical protein